MGRLEFWFKHPTWALVDWWFHTTSKHVFCPSCGFALEKGEQKRYETLLDHVEDPNEEYGERPLRDTWVCTHDQCIVCKTSTFFDEYGDIYIGRHWVYEPNEFKPSSAVGSRSWNMSRNLAFQRTKFYKALIFPAGGVLCWFGLHQARYRDRKDSAFCNNCLKELALTHPVGQTKAFLPVNRERELV